MYRIKSLYDNIVGETNRNIDAVRYENAKNTCDIIQAGNANTQRIIDTFTQDKIDQLRDSLQSANLALSNAAQTQNILSSIGRYVTNPPCPTPCNPCGCGGFAI